VTEQGKAQQSVTVLQIKCQRYAAVNVRPVVAKFLCGDDTEFLNVLLGSDIQFA